MTLAFIFPGQGSQAPGMGKSLNDAFAAAREVFQEIDEALGEKLSRLIFEGPAEELTLTANAQPALMAVSLAAMRALEREFGVAPQQGRVRRRPFARRILGARRRRRADDCRRRASCCACAATRCKRPCPSAKARWRR